MHSLSRLRRTLIGSIAVLMAGLIGSHTALATAPDVPTVAEDAAMANFETGSYQGIAAPAATPPATSRPRRRASSPAR